MTGHFWGFVVTSDPGKLSYPIRFGDDCDFDPRTYELRRAGRVLKLERIPMELLLLLIESSRWINDKQQRLGTARACVALANKNARILWSLIAKQQAYRPAV